MARDAISVSSPRKVELGVGGLAGDTADRYDGGSSADGYDFG